MATRIRLQRHGRKSRPIFTIVVADQRARRDGKFIQKLGQYNPNTNPATIELNFDAALDWVLKGAQPSDTVAAILRYKGVMMKKHLLGGVAKGALTAEQAEERFEKWLEEKEGKILGKQSTLAENKAKANEERLQAEAARNAARAEAIAAKNAPVVEETPEEGEAPAAETEETTQE
ncbi:MAG: 30S ribosomal protein S16 [Schleiferiaceae bacterium]|nr:30S ribosomal protein S16 [Schleiferiaceae bacterium]